MTLFDQSAYDICWGWGEKGIAALVPKSDVVVVVDVISFTTCVDIATARGAIVYPYRWRDFTSVDFAARIGADLAGSRQGDEGGVRLAAEWNASACVPRLVEGAYARAAESVRTPPDGDRSAEEPGASAGAHLLERCVRVPGLLPVPSARHRGRSMRRDPRPMFRRPRRGRRRRSPTGPP